jgi:hypothetical protein
MQPHGVGGRHQLHNILEEGEEAQHGVKVQEEGIPGREPTRGSWGFKKTQLHYSHR